MVSISPLLAAVNTLLYGYFMTQKRLSQSDWLRHGLVVLEEEGFTALKADALCQSLQVSRGSFYWHFANLADFHRQVLQRWRETTTDFVIQIIESSPSKRWNQLLGRAFSSQSRLEIAVRAWAFESSWVRTEVEAVDRARVDYLTSVYPTRNDDTQSVARQRAIFVYWAFLGKMLAPQYSISANDISSLADLLAGPAACNHD